MYKNRLINLRTKMRDHNIESVIILSDNNRNYITGFTGDESYAFVTLEFAYFLTDSRYTEQAKAEVSGFEVLNCSRQIIDFLKEKVISLNLKNIGFEEDTITVKEYLSFKENVNANFIALDGMIEELRIEKDASEIEATRKAAKIADSAFTHILSYIKSGVSEKDIALELEFYLRKNGATGLSFTTIVASGLRSALPHGVASDKKLQNGEFITLDFGCVFDHYCSDMTRTVVLGEPSEKMKDMYNVVLKAQTAALENFKPNVSCSGLDKIARDIITESGYGEYFGHGLGHGVGRAIHEAPAVNSKSKRILKPGFIVTNEPGIYIKGIGGVRIEDLILITEDGHEVLSQSSKRLIIL